jgi:IclR family KDG regulon transcriptional repressor
MMEKRIPSWPTGRKLFERVRRPRILDIDMASVPAVKRAIQVLELLVEEGDPLTLSGIAARTGIPMASCHAIVHTLRDAGYLRRRSEGRSQYWEPTLALYHLGSTLVARNGIRDIAQPSLRELSDKLGVPAHLGVLAGTDVTYVAKAAAPSFIQFDTYPGKRSPFHLTALGRAIAAYLPRDEREALLEGHGRRLRKILEDAHEAGYAVEDGEEMDGVGCIAAPVFGPDGRVLASVGITGFSRDLFPGDDVPAASAVAAAASAVSAELGHWPPAETVATSR